MENAREKSRLKRSRDNRRVARGLRCRRGIIRDRCDHSQHESVTQSILTGGREKTKSDGSIAVDRRNGRVGSSERVVGDAATLEMNREGRNGTERPRRCRPSIQPSGFRRFRWRAEVLPRPPRAIAVCQPGGLRVEPNRTKSVYRFFRFVWYSDRVNRN